MLKSFKILTIVLVMLLSSEAFAGTGTTTTQTSPVTNLGVVKGTLAVTNGGTGSTSFGETITTVDNILNTVQPSAVIANSAFPYTVVKEDGGFLLDLQPTSDVVLNLPPTSTSGFSYGFGLTLQNNGTGLVTVTTSGATKILGQSTFLMPSGTGCSFVSNLDGNYSVGTCSATTALSLPVVYDASHVLGISDAGKTVYMNCSTACTVTVPADATTNFQLGSFVNIVQYGVGAVTLVDTGITLHKASTLVFTGQYGGIVTVMKKASNEWFASGALQ